MMVTVLHDGYQTSLSYKQSAVGHFTDAWSNQDLGSLEARSFGFYVVRLDSLPVLCHTMKCTEAVLCYFNCYIETQQWLVHWFKCVFYASVIEEWKWVKNEPMSKEKLFFKDLQKIWRAIAQDHLNNFNKVPLLGSKIQIKSGCRFSHSVV